MPDTLLRARASLRRAFWSLRTQKPVRARRATLPAHTASVSHRSGLSHAWSSCCNTAAQRAGVVIKMMISLSRPQVRSNRGAGPAVKGILADGLHRSPTERRLAGPPARVRTFPHVEGKFATYVYLEGESQWSPRAPCRHLTGVPCSRRPGGCLRQAAHSSAAGTRDRA